MVRNILFTFSFLLLVVGIHGQAIDVKSSDNIGIRYEKVYRQALSLGDFGTAVSACHMLIAEDSKNGNWRDSLLVVYFKSGNYISSHLLSGVLIQERPQDDRLLEISAVSLVQLGALREAISAYEQLYLRGKKVEHAYELANLQYQIKRLAEAELTLSNLSSVEMPDSLGVRYPIKEGGSQVVNLKAAVYQLRGLVAYDLKQIDQATNYFKKALEIDPEFVVAKQNIEALTVNMNTKRTTSK